MRYLAATLLALISAKDGRTNSNSLLQQVQVFGAPMAVVQRAIQDLAPANLSKKRRQFPFLITHKRQPALGVNMA